MTLTTFSPQRDEYILMRRRYPSPMQGRTIDRAADRLRSSGHSLSDIPVLQLLHILHHEDLTRDEYHATLDELRRRSVHATHEKDLDDIQLLVTGKVVLL